MILHKTILVITTFVLNPVLTTYTFANDDTPQWAINQPFCSLKNSVGLFEHTQHLSMRVIDAVTDEYQLMANVDAIFNITDEPASFGGGYWELQKFISQYYHKPSENEVKSVAGKIYVRFVVTKEGDIKNIELVKGLHTLLDNEAMSLVRNMPRWIPAKIRGNNVASFVTIPIIVY